MKVYFQAKDEYMLDNAYQDIIEQNVSSITVGKDIYRLVKVADIDGTWTEKCLPKTYFELREVYEEV